MPPVTHNMILGMRAYRVVNRGIPASGVIRAAADLRRRRGHVVPITTRRRAAPPLLFA
eukprot:COSAG06_NODE_30758_length_532_cov_693.898383_1_plen_57_part_10